MAAAAAFLLLALAVGVRSRDTPVAATTPSLVKEIEDNSRYKTMEANATLLKLLVDNKDGVSRSEVFDMLHSRDEDSDHMDLPVFPEDAEDARDNVPTMPDAQAEMLQAHEELIPLGMQMSESIQVVNEERPAVGLAAGVMVLVTTLIVGGAYLGLLVWKRIYLKRNGLKHELLRNEDNIAETRIEL